jgi:hypothetical protein
MKEKKVELETLQSFSCDVIYQSFNAFSSVVGEFQKQNLRAKSSRKKFSVEKKA